MRPTPEPQPQQGSCERLFGPSSQDFGLTPRSGFCQPGQELPGLLRPPAANLPSQDHQTELFREGWPARSRFSPSCAWPQPRLLHVGGPGVRRTVAMQSRHEGGVHRQLGASEQGQPVPRSRFVFCPRDLDLPSQNLGTWHSRPLCSLPPCRCEPRRIPPANPAAPRIQPSHTVVAKIVERTATPTLTCGEGEGEAKTAMKADSE